MSSDIVLRHDHKALVIMDPSREWVFSSDPEGRIALIHCPEESWKRSRYNCWYRVVREPWPALTETDIEAIRERLHAWKSTWIAARKKAIRAGLSTAAGVLELWIERFLKFHEEDALRFARVYDAIPILPPDAYQALYVRIQEGCPWNQCAFCNFYRDRKYRIIDSDELEQHLLRLRGYWGTAVRSRHGLFLGDANAVAVPVPMLEERLRATRAVFPEQEISNIHSFLDFFAGPKRSSAEYIAVRNLGLNRLTLGLESGDIELMEKVGKPMNHSDVSRLVTSVHAAGISMNLIFLIGLGGRLRKDLHFRQSMDLIAKLRTGPRDRIYLSPLLIHSQTPYVSTAASEGWEELSESEMKEELNRWQQAIQSVLRIQVSPYHVRQFLY